MYKYKRARFAFLPHLEKHFALMESERETLGVISRDKESLMRFNSAI